MNRSTDQWPEKINTFLITCEWWSIIEWPEQGKNGRNGSNISIQVLTTLNGWSSILISLKTLLEKMCSSQGLWLSQNSVQGKSFLRIRLIIFKKRAFGRRLMFLIILLFGVELGLMRWKLRMMEKSTVLPRTLELFYSKQRRSSSRQLKIWKMWCNPMDSEKDKLLTKTTRTIRHLTPLLQPLPPDSTSMDLKSWKISEP